MSLKSMLLRLYFRPKVVHRLPGRVRIHIPLLRRVPADWHDMIPVVASLLTVPDRIDSAEACTVTGNLLIRYDLERASEAEVLGFFRCLSDFLIRNQTPLAKVRRERIHAVVETLKGVVRDAIRPDMTMDPGLDVSRDVLA